MMPPSQPATSNPPKRGMTATTRPATTSTAPTMYIASCALPGMTSLNSGARYLGQSEIITSANLSSPNRIGATVKATRSSMKAWAPGSLRSAWESGTGTGRSTAAMALLIVSSSGLRSECRRLLWRTAAYIPLAPVARANLRRRGFAAARHEVAQAPVLLVARGAPLEVGAHPRYLAVRHRALELEVDVFV